MTCADGARLESKRIARRRRRFRRGDQSVTCRDLAAIVALRAETNSLNRATALDGSPNGALRAARPRPHVPGAAPPGTPGPNVVAVLRPRATNGASNQLAALHALVAVANAVGAAAGLVKTRTTIELTYLEGGGYLLHTDAGPRSFSNLREALTAAKELAHAQEQSEAQKMGATGLRTTCDVQRVDIPNMPRDRSLISATIVVACVGISARAVTAAD